MNLSNRHFIISATDSFGYDVYRTDPLISLFLSTQLLKAVLVSFQPPIAEAHIMWVPRLIGCGDISKSTDKTIEG